MKNFKILSRKITRALLILFPPIFFFSYFPIISLGSSESMNFELSLPEIWLVVFFLFSLPMLKVLYDFYGKKKLTLAAIIPTYLSLTILWSDNRPRAILTAGLFWLLTFAALSIIYRLKTDKDIRVSLIKSLLISAVAVSAFCWLQCILDIVGISRDVTLLCRGCVSTTFGFPHPSGFAIEPQFMGNLLLAPTLLSFYLLIKKHGSTLLTLFLSSTLFLTLSRGAIYAFIIALVLMFVLIKKKPMVIRPIACAFISLALALASFGFFAVLGPTNDSFIDGTTKAIHQLTLGKIDLRPKSSAQGTPQFPGSTDTSTTTTVPDVPDTSTLVFTPENPNMASSASFSGYVEESTNTRLNLNSLALKTWVSSPKYILIGAGLGSAGPAMHQKFPEEIGPKEIVQNEYVSLLLETGLLGVALTLTVVIFTTIYLARRKLIKNNPLFISVALSFAFTLLFFSGLPNALHLYLFPLLLFNFDFSSKHDFLIANEVQGHRHRRH